MSFLPGMFPAGAAAAEAKAFGLTDTDYSSTDLTTYTFSGKSLGVPSATRRIIVAVAGISGSKSQTLSSVTVAGITATISVVRINSGNSNNGHVAIAIADVPTGLTGNVVVTWSGAMQQTMIGVYRAVKFSSGTAFDIAPATDIDGQGTMQIDVPEQGCVVAAAAMVNVSSSTWTGVTESNDQAEGGHSVTVAGIGLLPAETNRTVASSQSGGSPDRFCCASYG